MLTVFLMNFKKLVTPIKTPIICKRKVFMGTLTRYGVGSIGPRRDDIGTELAVEGFDPPIAGNGNTRVFSAHTDLPANLPEL